MATVTAKPIMQMSSTTRHSQSNHPHASVSVQSISRNKQRRPRKKRKTEAKESPSEVRIDKKPTAGMKQNQKYNIDLHMESSQQSATRLKVDRSGPPSRAALELSAKLKECSTNKRLKEALELYWDKANDSIRDTHHACIVVDCSARCGAIDEGEKVVENMIKIGMPVNIETNTALLKGYAHAGMMHKGASLFQKICREKGRQGPNVRTLNTLLRGCLWTAASVAAVEVHNKPCIAGGVVTAREAWICCGENRTGHEAFDSSSYEYYIALLCFALQTQDAQTKINEFKVQYNVSSKLRGGKIAEFNCDDPSNLETLAISLLNLARAQAVLGEFPQAKDTAQLVLSAADSVSLAAIKNQGKQLPEGRGNGGKRAWRDDAGSSRRSESNALFRSHRMTEIKSEAKWIFEVCSNRDCQPGIFTKSIATRLFYFSGGGTTGLMVKNQKAERTYQTHVLNTSWLSFGLKESIRAKSKPHGIDLVKNDLLNDSCCKTLFEMIDIGNVPVLDKKGFLHFPVVFKDVSLQDRNEGTLKRRKLKIELGAGFGDWIAEQARLNPHDNYVSVEMRSDRVAQAFAKAVLSKPELKNLSCVGAEAGSFLRERLRPESVSAIFVNHPEPPTQNFGSHDVVLASIADGTGEEPAHMLASSTLTSAMVCLEVTGNLIIVTDNRFYARLICATMVRALSTLPHGLFGSISLHGFTEVERFGPEGCCVHLYEGSPSPEIGHAFDKRSGGGGTSYFDRLWRTGASNHAEKRKRFVVVAARLGNLHEAGADTKGTSKKIKKRKFRVRGEQIK